MGGVVSLAASLTPIFSARPSASLELNSPLHQLSAAAVRYRIAVGPLAGRKTMSLRNPGGDGRRLQNPEKPALECLYIVIQAGGASASLGSG
jgi:hypothetical protein